MSFILFILWLLTDLGHVQYQHHGPVLLPNSVSTPGKVRTTDKTQVCTLTTKQFRNTTPKIKDQVCDLYNLPKHCYGRTTNEIDHLISLELGGDDVVENLWPQPYYQHPGAHEKDKLENWLHRQVCQGKLTLASAQVGIVKDWYQMYLDAGLDK